MRQSCAAMYFRCWMYFALEKCNSFLLQLVHKVDDLEFSYDTIVVVPDFEGNTCPMPKAHRRTTFCIARSAGKGRSNIH